MTGLDADPAAEPKPARAAPAFASGWGKHDTHALVLDDGRQNPHPSAGLPYDTIDGREISRMVERPPAVVPKDRARWFLPSTYREFDARVHELQRKSGLFYLLGLDIDRGNPALVDLLEALQAVTGDAGKLVYSTRSATADDRRWRALVPLAVPLPGADYADTATAFFNLLAERGLKPDRSLARPGQPIFLPNRGEFYEFHVESGPPLDLAAGHPIVRRREATRTARAEAERQAKQHRAERAARRQSQLGADPSPVDAFNAAHTIPELLGRYGYSPDPAGAEDWRSPMQTSGSYATRAYDGFWVSLSGSDAAAGLGRETESGYRSGDSFDLYVHFEHGGNFDAALCAYAAEAGLNRGRANGHDIRHRAGGTASPHRERPDMDGRADTAERPFAPRDEDLGDIEPTEHGVAAAFTARYADQFRFDYDIGKWFEWTGDHWRQDGSGRAFHLCCELARVASAGPKPSASVRRASFAAGVERIAGAHPAHIIGQSEWDADPWMLGCPGVTIDLRTGAGVAPVPAHLITKIAACAPAPSAECTRWLAFLAEATGGDAGLVRFLQQWTGYCLTGDTREHALIFLYGDGGTGKGTFMRTIASLAGSYAATAAMETFTASKFERHPTDLAALRGARLVTASETEKGRAWADARIKAITGGDPVKARFMRQDEFTYQPQLKLIIVGNHRPVLNDVDDAMRRRLNMVLFEKKPAQTDDQLEEKLRPEWPQILRWMLDGCLDWQRNGLVRPKSVLDATAEYFDAQDAVGHWIEERCTVERGNLHRWETARDLFGSWCDFAKAAGEVPGSAKGLGDVLSRRGFVRTTKRVEGKTPKVWCGITLNRPGGEP